MNKYLLAPCAWAICVSTVFSLAGADVTPAAPTAPLYFGSENTLPQDLFKAGTALGSCDLPKTKAYLETFKTSTENKVNPFNRVNPEFLVGLCHFYKEQLAAYPAAIDALQKAQLRGLDRAQQHLASFIEGLSHARLAGIFTKPTAADRPVFCGERAAAAAALGSVNWSAMSLKYEVQGSQPALRSLVEEMGNDYGPDGVLSSDFDGFCMIGSPIKGEEFATQIETQLKPLLDYYLGNTGFIGAMFSRKISRTEETISSAGEQIKQNNTDKDKIDKTLALYQDNFAPVKSRINNVVTKYREAVLDSYRIIDEFTKWQNGLWQDSKGVNQKEAFEKAVGDRQNEVNAIFDPDTQIPSKTASDLRTAVGIYKSLLVPQDTTADTRTLCAVFYCQIGNYQFWPSITNSDATKPGKCEREYKQATGTYPYTFCTTQGRKDIAALCSAQGVGFDASFINKESVPDIKGNTKMAMMKSTATLACSTQYLKK
ncbi:MAG TPA: hypothetical protein VE954_03985 [Oligoflexus sp.]|uniref:hypothetical protein n=1 Tax=Oligoflexus sp. TaxID=1971216 RepID=UPI002D3C0A4A|nr:hypothetical protein [Oligoflexus sp.]HYX32247.1 hypothetical protein [Oligoflexus sp.]